VQFDVTGDASTAADRVQPVLDAVAGVARAQSQVIIEQFGEATFARAYNAKLDKDYNAAETYSFPVTLAILLVAFGALVAAVLPVVLALTAVVAATGLATLSSHALHLDKNAMSVMALVGIAVGVDYSLFYLRRAREEMASGLSPDDAVLVAADTSGRSVMVSGLAVMVAMAGMFLSGNGIQSGMAEATIIVVAVAVLGSVTVLPAMLSLLGRRVDRGRLPRRRRPEAAPPGRLNRLLAFSLSRPVLALVVATGVMSALAVPALSLHTSDPGFNDLSARSLPALQTYARIQQAFPGSSAPAKVVVQGDALTTASFASFRAAVAAEPDLRGPVLTSVAPSGRVAILSLGLMGNGTDATSVRALETLRHQVIPSTLGVHAYVAGVTAESVDTNHQLSRAAPLVAGFVLVLTFLIMLVAFRSLTIAGLTIALNLLSVGAAYGVVVLIFQYGYGAGLLGFTTTHGITSWVPLFMFVILFGLSMDYHVFVVSRIREGHDRGLPTAEAVSRGISRSAGVVTSAAIVMVAVAGVFGLLPQVSMKEAGVGMSTAVLLDATLIRIVLLPAAMRLLGERNWWLPNMLAWLPRLQLESAGRDVDLREPASDDALAAR
jgi:uncharacterized membrane protein YdfJ with MMPL/SSD domain